MRISRLIAPAVLALTFAACSKDKDPTGLTEDQKRLEAAAKLQDMSVNMPDAQSRAAVKQAGTMLNLGAPVTEITMSTGAAASIARNATFSSRPSAAIGGGSETWSATALQVVITNSSTANGTYNVFVMWKGDEDLVFVGAPDAQESSTISTSAGSAFGGLFTAPSASWRATAGTAAINNTSVATTCSVTASVTGITCKDAQFTGTFSITDSDPFAVAGTNTASGSRTAGLSPINVPGIQVTVNCSLYNC